MIKEIIQKIAEIIGELTLLEFGLVTFFQALKQVLKSMNEVKKEIKKETSHDEVSKK